MKVKFYLLILLFLISVSIFGALTRPASPTSQIAVATPGFPLLITCARAKEYVSGEICVQTEPQALVSLSVRYCSGELANSFALNRPELTNDQGRFVWAWVPETVCSGTAIADVTAQWHGMRMESSVRFVVE